MHLKRLDLDCLFNQEQDLLELDLPDRRVLKGLEDLQVEMEIKALLENKVSGETGEREDLPDH